MKKLFFLMSVLFFAVSCSAYKPLPFTEMMDSSFAYVVGRTDGDTYDMWWEHNDVTGKDDPKITLTSDESYPVYKVRPGKYVFISATFRTKQITPAAGGEKVSFIALPGKITYVGDLTITSSGSTAVSQPHGLVTFEYTGLGIQVQDSSEAVKNAVNMHYPHLRDQLDTAFVYQPPAHRSFDSSEGTRKGGFLTPLLNILDIF